jgi:hypothetical protein
VTNDLIVTPGGYRPRSNVHMISPGQELAIGAAPRALTRKAQPGPPDTSNWISYAYWLNETKEPITLFRTAWQVPPAPATQASQLIYLFNGIEPADGSIILQPVLQWGDSGADEDGMQRTGPFWTVASWSVGTEAHHTPHVRVNPGDLLVGVITLLDQADGQFRYSCEFQGVAGTAHSLKIGSPLVWCAVTLEAYENGSSAPPPYDLNAVSEYPPCGATAFKTINIRNGSGQSVNWAVNDIVRNFGEHTRIVSNSETEGEVDICYRGDATTLQHVDENLQSRIEQLKQEKALLDAQKAKLAAERDVAEAQKALDQGKDNLAQQLTELQRAKALSDAQKSLADSQGALQQTKSGAGQKLAELQTQKSMAEAEKALADAQTQALLARYIGDIKAGPYSGTVSMKEKAGTIEALLLGARAIKEGAAKIANAVQKAGVSKFYLFGSKEFPDFQHLITFRCRGELVRRAFEAAGIESHIRAKGLALPALASAGLDAASKILGFFKTDYEIGGIDVKLDESQLIFAVAGRIKDKEVHLPIAYAPNTHAGAIAELAMEMAELANLRCEAAEEALRIKDQIAGLEKEAANKDALKSTLDHLTGVIALYDSFESSLTVPDPGTGIAPLALLAQEFMLDKVLREDGVAVLLLRLENTGGGYLLKKNLFTGLGQMPLYHMGGATVSYLLLNGSDGRVIGGDVYPIHGGFIRTDQIRDLVKY